MWRSIPNQWGFLKWKVPKIFKIFYFIQILLLSLFNLPFPLHNSLLFYPIQSTHLPSLSRTLLFFSPLILLSPPTLNPLLIPSSLSPYSPHLLHTATHPLTPLCRPHNPPPYNGFKGRMENFKGMENFSMKQKNLFREREVEVKREEYCFCLSFFFILREGGGGDTKI